MLEGGDRLTTAQFWLAAAEIVVINVLLSADNAVVLALACRHLARNERTVAMACGVLSTVFLLVGLTAFAAKLLALPYLKLVGGGLLAWIGIKLVVDERVAGDEDALRNAARVGSAVKTVIVADLAMSFDNVLGVAAVANGNFLLLAVGLGIRIPLVVFGGGLLIRLMDRLRWLPIAGGGLLGYVAGELMARDPALTAWIDVRMSALHRLLPVTGMALVVLTGLCLMYREPSRARRSRVRGHAVVGRSER